ncbi:acetylxylan esterase [Sunxiuqinia indica]|uniref:acetylxylan esterase n=1 Tax=Sunxiuqinia indica TaxID=2692584 RepID=UPI00135C981D|nr:acetylxylan esterase [Sunxiuqinia indica]
MRSKLFFLIWWMTFAGMAPEKVFCQPKEEFIKVVVSPDHSDWNYAVNESVRFSIKVLKSNVALEGAQISYTIGPEKMPAIDSATVAIPESGLIVDAKGMAQPGFLRCTATFKYENKTYTGTATVGYEPKKIKPTGKLPKDFEEFWNQGKMQLKEIPLEPVFRELPEREAGGVKVYEVSFNNITGKIFGVLCVPTSEGKHPALLEVPGAGVWPMYGDVEKAKKGIITLAIGIHGIPVTMESSVYANLREGALKDYWYNNLDNRDDYYFKRVFLGCVRAVDFLCSLSEFDGENIAVAGGSQGGALSIVTASLDSRIDYLAVRYPAFCDHTGFLHGRAGGWPFHFQREPHPIAEKVETSAYYDVVNFARFIKVPGLYSWGYNDGVCGPTSTFSAYNTITAPKEIFIVPETAHWTYPEQEEKLADWLIEKLTKN